MYLVYFINHILLIKNHAHHDLVEKLIYYKHILSQKHLILKTLTFL